MLLMWNKGGSVKIPEEQDNRITHLIAFSSSHLAACSTLCLLSVPNLSISTTT